MGADLSDEEVEDVKFKQVWTGEGKVVVHDTLLYYHLFSLLSLHGCPGSTFTLVSHTLITLPALR